MKYRSESRLEPSGAQSAVDTSLESHSLPERNQHQLWGGLFQHSEETCPGHHRRRIAFNTALMRAYEAGDASAWIFTRMRCEVLQMSAREVAAAVGLGTQKAVLSLEQPGENSQPQIDTYTRVLAFWNATATDDSLPAEQATTLIEARERVLDLLCAPFGRGVDMLLRRWRYEAGTQLFREATGLDSGGLHQRAKNGVPSSPLELLTFARNLNFIDSNIAPEQLWQHPRMKEIVKACIQEGRKRYRARPVVNLHALVACSGDHFSSLGLSGRFETFISKRAASQLARFEMVPWEQVQPLVRGLVAADIMNNTDEKYLKKTWHSAIKRQPVSFEANIRRALPELAITPGEIASAAGVSAGPESKRGRFVRRALRFGEYQQEITPAHLAALVAGDRSAFETLLDQKRQEVRRYRIRSGGAELSALQVERAIWGRGVTGEVSETENDSAASEDMQIERLRQAGLANVIAFLEQAVCGDRYLTVARTAAHIGQNATRQSAVDAAHTSKKTLNRMQADGVVIDRSRYQFLLQADGFPFGFRQERAWYESSAAHAFGNGTPDLGRALQVWMLSHSQSVTAFLRGNACPQSLIIAVRHAITTGRFSDATLGQLLKSCEIEKKKTADSALGLFLKAVDVTGTIQTAIPRFAQALVEGSFSRELRGLQVLARLAKQNMVNADNAAWETRLDQMLQRAQRVLSLSADEINLSAEEQADALLTLRVMPGVMEPELARFAESTLSAVDALIEDQNWVERSKEEHPTVTQRISRLAERLEAGRSVTTTDVYTLFAGTAIGKALGSIAAATFEPRELPYYVAGLRYYEDPEGALAVLEAAGPDQKFFRHRGPDFLQYSKTYAESRQQIGKGKIASASIRLYLSE